MTEHGNGIPVGFFETGGPIVADGTMFVHVRPEGGAEKDWIVARLVTNSTRGNQPPDQRNRLGLTSGDAAKFKVVGVGQAALRRIEIAGKPLPHSLSVVCTVPPGDIPASVFLVDPLAGVLHIDGPSGSWSWKVKL